MKLGEPRLRPASKAQEIFHRKVAKAAKGRRASPPGNPNPIIRGTDRFDPKPFDGKAVILRIDGSVSSVYIDKDGHALVGGMNLLSPANPVWGVGDKLDIRYPE